MYVDLKLRPVLAGISLFALIVCPALGQLSVDPPASNALFLQRDRPNRLQGNASPGETVTVCLGEVEADSLADENGRWRAELPAISKPGGPFTLTIRSEQESIAFNQVMVGDIWLCSGQSNMQWPLKSTDNAKQEIAAAAQPLLRLLHIGHRASLTPLDDVRERWEICTPESAADFSAVAYFFGRELARDTGVPIGLIANAWGGKPAEPFVRREALLANPRLAPYVEQAQRKAETFEDDLKAWEANHIEILTQWQKTVQEAKARGVKWPLKPTPPPAPDSPQWPQNIWNGMVNPLTAIPITGVIWYQGESNTDRPLLYRTLLQALIRDWRAQWNQPDLPFYIVQLANYKKRRPGPSESRWAELRESQSVAAQLPATGLAVTIDIGEADTIHPPNKQEVGRRLALWALRDYYNQDVDCASPAFSSIEIDGGQVTVHFRHADGLHTRDGGPVKGFALAGDDRKFFWADGELLGESVVLTSPRVPHPVAVRYAWGNNPGTNLYNSANLPAAPFRTDDWIEEKSFAIQPLEQTHEAATQ